MHNPYNCGFLFDPSSPDSFFQKGDQGVGICFRHKRLNSCPYRTFLDFQTGPDLRFSKFFGKQFKYGD